ncbi:DUF3310 domain-containing protein [Rhizobium rhizogenes]
MEPIEEWMQEPTKKPPGRLNDREPVRIGAAEVIFEDPTWAQGDGRHPDEDCFQVPHEVRDGELTSVPPIERGTPEEQLALFEFMNVASAAERLTGRDNVVLPQHYARFNIEPIRFICENNLNFFQANITKYILRWDAKNGLEDLHKAKRYLEMFIKFVQKDPDWWKADGNKAV